MGPELEPSIGLSRVHTKYSQDALVLLVIMRIYYYARSSIASCQLYILLCVGSLCFAVEVCRHKCVQVKSRKAATVSTSLSECVRFEEVHLRGLFSSRRDSEAAEPAFDARLDWTNVFGHGLTLSVGRSKAGFAFDRICVICF
ncbi:unnamed protein product [Protopolystoma xenopodis]|uniref:Uncharacterized protein n=1 Tax=Protopolystoma xenopodis TaxID=117903 RepID=A0A3S5BRP9_9PLAT|nr:unnamed protein product [Protopolystoma xenopodis]